MSKFDSQEGFEASSRAFREGYSEGYGISGGCFVGFREVFGESERERGREFEATSGS